MASGVTAQAPCLAQAHAQVVLIGGGFLPTAERVPQSGRYGHGHGARGAAGIGFAALDAPLTAGI